MAVPPLHSELSLSSTLLVLASVEIQEQELFSQYILALTVKQR